MPQSQACPSAFRLQARRRRELPELKAVEDDHAWDAVSSLPPAVCILHAAPHLPQPSLSLLGSLVRARLGTIPDWTPLVRRRAPPHSSHVPREGALSLAQSQWKYLARRAHEGRTCRACAPNRTGDELLPRALRARAADRQRWHRTSNIERRVPSAPSRARSVPSPPPRHRAALARSPSWRSAPARPPASTFGGPLCTTGDLPAARSGDLRRDPASGSRRRRRQPAAHAWDSRLEARRSKRGATAAAGCTRVRALARPAQANSTSLLALAHEWGMERQGARGFDGRRIARATTAEIASPGAGRLARAVDDLRVRDGRREQGRCRRQARGSSDSNSRDRPANYWPLCLTASSNSKLSRRAHTPDRRAHSHVHHASSGCARTLRTHGGQARAHARPPVPIRLGPFGRSRSVSCLRPDAPCSPTVPTLLHPRRSVRQPRGLRWLLVRCADSSLQRARPPPAPVHRKASGSAPAHSHCVALVPAPALPGPPSPWC